MPDIYSLFTIISLAFISFILIIKHKRKIEKISNNYTAIQKIHDNYVPPLGGLIIFIFFYLYLILFKNNSLFLNISIFFPSLMIIAIGIKEDIRSNVSPNIRLFILIVASFICIYNLESLPKIDIEFVNTFFIKFPLFEILFYVIGLTALSNGVNMIDGTNGLAGLSILTIIFGLLSLIYLTGDYSIKNFLDELVILFLLMTLFLFFNFPFGKIFLGDAGAYWLGWIAGVYIIKIFALENLNTWVAVLLIFYPIYEVIFSFFRKILQNKNPLKPDLEHLHLKLYYTLKGPTVRSREFNSFTTLCLMPLWFTPSILIVWSFFFAHIAILGIIFLTFIYTYFYNVIPKKF